MDWTYDAWPSGEPYDWQGTSRGSDKWVATDFHVDLGCGKVKKGRIGVDRFPARGVNVVMDFDTMALHAVAREPGGDAVTWDVASQTHAFHHDNDGLSSNPLHYPTLHGVDFYPVGFGLPFGTDTIESVISHHALEHLGDGFIRFIDEIYRVLVPGGLFYAVTPLFPSWSAVTDPDHRRYFLAAPPNEHHALGECTWDAFCGTPEHHWCESFSEPYTAARFEKLWQDMTARSENPREWWTPADARELRVALKAVK